MPAEARLYLLRIFGPSSLGFEAHSIPGEETTRLSLILRGT